MSIYNLTTDTLAIRTSNNGLASGVVGALALDTAAGELYIGTYEGLSIYNPTSNTFAS
ncbi:MAG: hypothetical protein ACE5R6_12475 [Candidatus Heimdallarchaeota archaeon]